MLRSILIIFLKYVVGLGILSWVAYRNWDVTQDGQQVGLSIITQRPIDGWAFALGLAVCGAAVALTFTRWYILVRALDLPIQRRDVARLGLIGFFFNNFLPGAVSGDLVKAAFLAREQSRRTLAIATVVLDRIVGLAGLFWLVAIFGGGLYLAGDYEAILENPTARLTVRSILGIACLVVVGTIGGWIFLGLFRAAWLDRVEARLERIPKLGPMLAEMTRAVRIYRQKGTFVALALGLSMLSHFLLVVGFYCGARIFNPADNLPPITTHLVIVPIGTTIRSLIPLPGGVGGAEIGFGKLYELVGYPFSSGVLGSIGQLAIMWSLGVAGFVVYQIMDYRRRG
ncbi:MAG: lysylphosphatidylglycerol synthase transmembrane domain-containing protein [Planctomycetota bacterium]